MALGGLIWEAWGGSGWTAALLAAVGFWMRLMLTGALGFPFFLLRMTGAGDVKLMAVIAAAMGGRRGAVAIGVGLCLGAVLALVRMLRYGSTCQRFLYLFAYIRDVFQSKRPEPYYLLERDGTGCVIPLGACLWIDRKSVV